MTTNNLKFWLTALFGVFFSYPALSHHPLGGGTPETLTNGFLSGIGHPIIGADHLAFVVAVGVLAVLVGSRLTMPLWFILATMAGALLHLASLGLPSVEFVIALSVALIGVVLFAGRALPKFLLASVILAAVMICMRWIVPASYRLCWVRDLLL